MQNARDHYQSHREFGRELSNNTSAGPSSGTAAHLVHPILSTKAAATNAAAQTGGGNNISIFKNFIQQY